MTRLGIAQQLADRMAKAAAARGGEIKPLDPTGFRDSFIQALNHDLDAPAGLEVIKALVERILDASEAGQDVSAAQKQLRDFGHVYGLRLNQPPDPDVMAGWEKHWRKFR